MNFLKKIFNWFWPFKKGYTVVYVEGDELPENLPKMKLIVAREDGELWAAGMNCPCGCGARMELMLLKEARPRWDLVVDDINQPTLHPSVWRNKGCRSHFWLQSGNIIWCNDN